MSQPVGPEFGLDPRIDRTIEQPSPTSISPVSTDDYRTGTEFGGVAGLVQPPPHVPTTRERLMMIHLIDPTDTGQEDGSVVAPELEGF